MSAVGLVTRFASAIAAGIYVGLMLWQAVHGTARYAAFDGGFAAFFVLLATVKLGPRP